jgi:hypothetical protein
MEMSKKKDIIYIALKIKPIKELQTSPILICETEGLKLLGNENTLN